MAKVVKVNEIYAEGAKAPEALTIVHFGHKLRDTPIGSNSVQAVVMHCIIFAGSSYPIQTKIKLSDGLNMTSLGLFPFACSLRTLAIKKNFSLATNHHSRLLT